MQAYVATIRVYVFPNFVSPWVYRRIKGVVCGYEWVSRRPMLEGRDRWCHWMH